MTTRVERYLAHMQVLMDEGAPVNLVECALVCAAASTSGAASAEVISAFVEAMHVEKQDAREIIGKILEPTGDGKYAAEVADYDDKFGDEVVALDWRWAHAKMTSGALPELVVDDLRGYDLTHAVLYATDFGRQPITDSKVADYVAEELAKTEDGEVATELLICLCALGVDPPTDRMEVVLAYFDAEDWPQDAKEMHPRTACALLFACVGD